MTRTRSSPDSSPCPTQRRRLDFTESGSGPESEGINQAPSHIPLQNFKCKISTNCKLAKEVEFITECLRDHPNGMNWFKESQFGHLFEVAPHIEMCLTPLWMLLTRRVETEKKHETWFVLNGTPIRYSLMEHALISGLNCAPIPQEYPGGYSFKDRNFKGKITLKVVRQKLQEMEIPPGAEGQVSRRNQRSKSAGKQMSTLLEDKVRMAVLYFVCSVFMNHTKDGTHISDSTLRIIDDLKFARTYPWGRTSYNHLMIHVKALDLESKLNVPSWSCPGFILPLMLLPFECISALSPKFARIREDATGPLPRICRWSTLPEKKKQAPTLHQVLEVVGNSKDIKSILTPTPEELQA